MKKTMILLMLLPAIISSKPDQIVYRYTNEGLSFSDLTALYKTTAAKEATPFFRKNSIRRGSASVSCTITKTILHSTATITQVAFELSDIRLSIRNGDQVINTDMLRREIARPAFTIFGPEGSLISVSTDSSISHASATMIKEILSRFQLAKPARQGQTWEVKETNSLGEFSARYQSVRNDRGIIGFNKTNMGYTHVPPSLSQLILRPAGTSLITTDQARDIVGINSSETLAVMTGNDTIAISGSTIKIEKVGQSAAGESLLSKLGQLYGSASV